MKAQKIGAPYNELVTNLIPGFHDREIQQIRDILERYTSNVRICEMMLFFDTQICEALNNAQTFVTPKNRNFATTRSFELRKCHVIGIHNDGHYA